MSSQQIVVRAAFAVLVLLLGACASDPHLTAPPVQRSANAALQANAVLEQVASTARRMIGTPYRFGGRTPAGSARRNLLGRAVVRARTLDGQARVDREA